MRVKEIEEVLISHEQLIQALAALLQEQDMTMKALNTTMKNYIQNTKLVLEQIAKELEDGR